MHYEQYFLKDPATTEIHTLSLHDALPISSDEWRPQSFWRETSFANHIKGVVGGVPGGYATDEKAPLQASVTRSEEHTSELQSRQYLVCRLLLEKKNKIFSSRTDL